MEKLISKLKQKMCLGFPIEPEPVVDVEKNESGFRATMGIFGVTVEDLNWHKTEEDALKEIVEIGDKLIGKIYKMALYKYKTDKTRKMSQNQSKEKSLISSKGVNKIQESSTIVPRKQPSYKQLAHKQLANKQPSHKQLAQTQHNKQPSQKPKFAEDIKETKSNIIYSVSNMVKNPGEFIEQYCKSKAIAFPEYLFEKSNGVYLCRATFLKERFESRYAYEIETAKREVANLIVSFIRYKILESKDEDCRNLLDQFTNPGEKTLNKALKKTLKNTFKIEDLSTNVKEELLNKTLKKTLKNTFKIEDLSTNVKEELPFDSPLDNCDIQKLFTEFNNFEKEVNQSEIQDIVNCFSNLYEEDEDFLNFKDLNE
ncbi:hypothetical protein NGRA_0317 [Nosema granulosis]|uniref:Uncharacterized protein n=1 Tax=Nosema granulosis TaxID=83296 RepID=A0A9P6H3A1_9MICR|nr:hypothetical protein NGRA_0317 [Nosema granulosis]